MDNDFINLISDYLFYTYKDKDIDLRYNIEDEHGRPDTGTKYIPVNQITIYSYSYSPNTILAYCYIKDEPESISYRHSIWMPALLGYLYHNITIDKEKTNNVTLQ